MAASIVESVESLRFPWQTVDPFLFCVYHVDDYPAGTEEMGPKASLEGRNLGQDFGNKDGWNMYHGKEIPGFPRHPHRGFETVTFTRRGLIDHSDSLASLHFLTCLHGHTHQQAGHGREHIAAHIRRRLEGHQGMQLGGTR
jgi:redox-sensitive bicupin YhaK (pirin superfamily)